MISSYAYTLDNAGNHTKVVEHTGRTVEYTYDDTDKLLEETITNPDISVSVISYTYDKVGNRLTKVENGFTTTYQYDANNRLIWEDDADASVRYSYDDNGNLTEKESAEEDVLYFYDAENHLIRVETTRFGATIVVEYEYDDEGNRVRKTIDDTVVINYLVDTNRDYAQVLEERDGDGDLIVRYVHGHDLISQARGGATTYYHYDGLGSTRALTNSAEAVIDTYTYDAFGNLLDKTGGTVNTHLYTGEFFDMNLGFYYLRARYMNPTVGRFVTMDTFAGRNHDPYSLHKYLYARANPVTYSDPSGYLYGDISVYTKESGKIDAQQARHAQKVMIPVWKRIVAGILVTGYVGAVSTLPSPAFPDPMEARAYQNAAILRRLQTEVQIELGREDDSSGRIFYRGLSKLDLQEFYHYWLIFANALRGPDPKYLGKGRKWSAGEAKTVLTEILSRFNGSVHAAGDSGWENSPFISVTTREDIAVYFAHYGKEGDPTGTGGPSRHVLMVKTRRAIENLVNRWEEYHYDGGVFKKGQAEWLVPLVIVRKAETIGEPYMVSPPTKHYWE